MKIISLNVGLPRLVMRNGEPVSTGIFKEPVAGRLMLRTLNLDGDRQSDLSVHGGPQKAVYGYPSEHYEFWKRELPEMNLAWGMFGENFTTEGIFEDINIGDRFRIGSAEVNWEFALAARTSSRDFWSVNAVASIFQFYKKVKSVPVMSLNC
jgi:MOSC domain-containing protein YiiM